MILPLLLYESLPSTITMTSITGAFILILKIQHFTTREFFLKLNYFFFNHVLFWGSNSICTASFSSLGTIFQKLDFTLGSLTMIVPVRRKIQMQWKCFISIHNVLHNVNCAPITCVVERLLSKVNAKKPVHFFWKSFRNLETE